MSPGCVTRLVCADGTRAFVKAVGAELNPDSPTLYRREVAGARAARLAPAVGRPPGVVRRRRLGRAAARGRRGPAPRPADDATMARLLEATDELGRVMRERVPDAAASRRPPAANPLYAARAGRPAPASTPAGRPRVDHLHEVPAGPAAAVGARRRRRPARPGSSTLAAEPMEHLVHYDIRNDNLLVRPTGEIVFLDWGACGVGPDWLDPLLARVERVHLPWFDASLASSPALVRAGDDVGHLVAGRDRRPPRLARPHRGRRRPADAGGVPARGVGAVPRGRGPSARASSRD